MVKITKLCLKFDKVMTRIVWLFSGHGVHLVTSLIRVIIALASVDLVNLKLKGPLLFFLKVGQIILVPSR